MKCSDRNYTKHHLWNLKGCFVRKMTRPVGKYACRSLFCIIVIPSQHGAARTYLSFLHFSDSKRYYDKVWFSYAEACFSIYQSNTCEWIQLYCTPAPWNSKREYRTKASGFRWAARCQINKGLKLWGVPLGSLLLTTKDRGIWGGLWIGGKKYERTSFIAHKICRICYLHDTWRY